MSLLSGLRRDKRFFGTCPHCNEDFRLADAKLFSLKDPFPNEALARVAAHKDELKAAREALKARRRRMTEGAQVTAESVNLGKMLEKIIPSFDDFQFTPRDCRSLFEPIDYIVFSGLSNTGTVQSIVFVDVKSGKAQLTKSQRTIAAAIQSGNVQFKIA